MAVLTAPTRGSKPSEHLGHRGCPTPSESASALREPDQARLALNQPSGHGRRRSMQRVAPCLGPSRRCSRSTRAMTTPPRALLRGAQAVRAVWPAPPPAYAPPPILPHPQASTIRQCCWPGTHAQVDRLVPPRRQPSGVWCAAGRRPVWRRARRAARAASSPSERSPSVMASSIIDVDPRCACALM